MHSADAFKHILTSLHEAMLDDARWPATSALIDEACGRTGNALVVGEGPKNDVRVGIVGLFFRGERREDLEREYLEDYHPIDERVPRLRQQPHGRLVHVTDQYTAEELKTSRAYNEALRRGRQQNGFAVRVAGSGGTHLTWAIGDPVGSGSWASSQVSMLERLVPHVGQFVRVRQALVRAEARSTTVTALLDNPRVGVVHLDRRGRILSANDRARDILRAGDGMTDRDGELHARKAGDEARLAMLVAAALPAWGAVAVSGSMLLRRVSALPPLAVHVKPVPVPQPGLRGAARCRARPDCGAGAPASGCSGAGGVGARVDAGGEPRRGRAGGRQERSGDRRDDGTHEACNPLAPEADLRETACLPASGPGPPRAVANGPRAALTRWCPPGR